MMVQEGSRRFDALELHRTSAKSPCTPCFSSKYVDRGGSVVSNHPEPMLKNSTHFFISVIREGSRMFDALELHRTSAKSPCTPCFSSKYVDRGGSVVSNQPEPMLKNSTHFAISAMMWFKKVRGGSTSSSNLHKPHHHRDSKVCRGLSHEFGVVRLYRTFSIYIFRGEARCAG